MVRVAESYFFPFTLSRFGPMAMKLRRHSSVVLTVLQERISVITKEGAFSLGTRGVLKIALLCLLMCVSSLRGCLVIRAHYKQSDGSDDEAGKEWELEQIRKTGIMSSRQLVRASSVQREQ